MARYFSRALNNPGAGSASTPQRQMYFFVAIRFRLFIMNQIMNQKCPKGVDLRPHNVPQHRVDPTYAKSLDSCRQDPHTAVRYETNYSIFWTIRHT